MSHLLSNLCCVMMRFSSPPAIWHYSAKVSVYIQNPQFFRSDDILRNLIHHYIHADLRRRF